MTRPRLLDLFCGAGGAAMGYHRAGFDVVGVDINPQPHYPFAFVQADAMTYPLEGFDAIHASPPCQAYSVLRHRTGVTYYGLIARTRFALASSGLPYVIENVVGAPLVDPVRLCGSSFGLGVRRHRLFEMSDPPALVPTCAHYQQPAPLDVTGSGGPSARPRVGGGRSRKPSSMAQASDAMGIDWPMTRAEISEAIPPAFTEWIGGFLWAEITDRTPAAISPREGPERPGDKQNIRSTARMRQNGAGVSARNGR